MDDSERDEWRDYALDLFEAAVGSAHDDMDRATAAAEGEWCLEMYDRLAALLEAESDTDDEE